MWENKVKPYENEEQYDLRISYSGLDIFSQCPLRYSIKYNQGIFSEQQTIALEIGSICHKVLELKANILLNSEKIDYQYLKNILFNGYTGTNVSETENILGVEEIKRKYGIKTWLERESGSMNYEEKIKLFIDQVVPTEVPNNMNSWKTYASEMPFDFIYLVDVPDLGIKKVRFNGFIDRVDTRVNNDQHEYRVVDYKTSKKVYDSSKLATPLQMIIYGLFVALKTGQLPVEYQYSFILLDEKADACSRGYLKRGLNKLDNLLGDIFKRQVTNKWDAKGSALCYWCDYNRQGLLKDPKVMNICEHFCLWTPDNKTFECVEPWSLPATDTINLRPDGKRKLMF